MWQREWCTGCSSWVEILCLALFVHWNVKNILKTYKTQNLKTFFPKNLGFSSPGYKADHSCWCPQLSHIYFLISCSASPHCSTCLIVFTVWIDSRLICSFSSSSICDSESFIHSFISGMHHYECVASNVDINLQSGRFWATSIAWLRERFIDFRSCWVVFIHVVRGRPGGLQFSKAEAVKICLASDSSGICAILEWTPIVDALNLLTTMLATKNSITSEWVVSPSSYLVEARSTTDDKR